MPGTTTEQVVHALNERALVYAEDSVRMTAEAGGGHPSSALSLVHIVSALFYKMRQDPANPWDPRNDRIVLSEGHAVPVIYAALAEAGAAVGTSPGEARPLTRNDLLTLRDIDSPLDGHPNPVFGVRFFDTATGSLGQGLSNANGLILADRLKGIRRRVYCIAGDSEVREGQYDEASRFAAKYGTDVVLFININGYGQSGATKDLMPMDHRAELEARGWVVLEVDGHDVARLVDVIEQACQHEGRPVAILAYTKKGWGVKKLQSGNPHGKPLKKEDVDEALGELRALSQGTATRIECQKPSGSMPRAFKEGTRLPRPAFDDEKLAPRKAYGKALVELGKINERVVVLDAEVSNSTFTQEFREAFPDRFFECAIAEQNMMGVAGGLAAGGLIPFVNSFGKFLVMAYAQFEMNGLSDLNFKVVGSHVGITPCSDGPSQMALSDVPYMMSQPGLVVLSASDAIQGYKFVELAVRHEGWIYQRNFRPDVPFLYSPDTEFRIGGACALQEGDAITIVSHGYMVHMVKKAAQRLENEKGIRPTIIDAYSLKPLDMETILAAADKTDGRIVTVEDNYNGLGLAVAESAAQLGYRVKTMSLRRFPKSAREIPEIMAYCGLSVDDIVDVVLAAVK